MNALPMQRLVVEASHETPHLRNPIDPPSGLRRIMIEDHETMVQSAIAGQVQSWSHFFPYLYLFGNFDGVRHLFYEIEDGALLVYMVEPAKEMRISLFVTPFPFSPVALARAEERMKQSNADRVARIIRMQESDALRVARHGYEIRHHSEEFVYDREAVTGLIGSGFSTVRRKVRHYAVPEVRMRPYEPSDASACTALLRQWRTDLRDEGVQISSYFRYAKACLTEYMKLPPDLLQGQVIEIAGEIGAFTFGGPITTSVGSVFITVAERRHPGLAYAQRHHFVSQFRELEFMNDAHDSGRPGLAQMKRAFCPVRMHGVFSARKGADLALI